MAQNSCRVTSWSLWNAANQISTSVRSCVGELFRLLPSSLLSMSLSLLLSLSLSLLLSSSSELLLGEIQLVACWVSACVQSTRLCFCFVAVAIATRNAIRAAATDKSRNRGNPCDAPQSTLQRQGGGVIWEEYSLCAARFCALESPLW